MKKILIIIAIELAILTGLMVFGLVKNGGDDSVKEADVQTATQQPAATKEPVVKPTETATSTTVKPAKKPFEPFTISFAGDILLDQGMDKHYESADKDINSIVSKKLVKYLNSSDLFVANQEFPFSTRGTKAKNKKYTFRVDPGYANIMTEIGTDIVTLANNHSLDYGEDALLDTFATLDDAKIKYMGAGKNLARAKKVITKTVNGKKIAFVAASRVIPVDSWNATDERAGVLSTYDPKVLVAQIKKAKKSADLVFVYVHWGTEKKESLEKYQKTLAKQYIDAGADAVIGSHTHCLQGMEYYNGKPIIYSLGNFIFGKENKSTMVLTFTVDEKCNLTPKIVPCTSKNYTTSIITDADAKAKFIKDYQKLCVNVNISKKGKVTEKK